MIGQRPVHATYGDPQEAKPVSTSTPCTVVPIEGEEARCTRKALVGVDAGPRLNAREARHPDARHLLKQPRCLGAQLYARVCAMM